jgi:6-phosphofructokinase
MSLRPPASSYLAEPQATLQIFGIKYGLRGFYDRATKPVHLTPETVDGIQLRGGTILVRLPGACL